MINYNSDLDRLELVRGEGGSFSLDITGYELQPTDRLILNVRELPSEASPLLLQSISASNIIRLDCEATKDLPAGLFSAQIFLESQQFHCPIELWPQMTGTPKQGASLKNFCVFPKV